MLTQTSESGRPVTAEATASWQPAPLNADNDPRVNAKPIAYGQLIATVDGANSCPHGAKQIHPDRLGRVRIWHYFQADLESSTCVRMVQRCAGAGMGSTSRLSDWQTFYFGATNYKPS